MKVFIFLFILNVKFQSSTAQWGYDGYTYGGYGGLGYGYGGHGYDSYGYGSYGYGNPYPSGFYQQSPFIVQQLPSYTQPGSGSNGQNNAATDGQSCTSQADCGNKSLFCVSGQCQSMEPTTQKCNSNEECPSGICKARFCWGPPGASSQTPDQQQPDQNQNTQQPDGHCNTQDDCSATQMCSKVTANTCVKGYSIEITCSSDSDCDKKDVCKAGTCWKEGEPGGGEPGDPCKDHEMRGRFYVWEKQRLQIFSLLGKSRNGWRPIGGFMHCIQKESFLASLLNSTMLAGTADILNENESIKNLTIQQMTEDNNTEEFPAINAFILVRIFEKHRTKNYQKHITGYSFGILLLSLSMILHNLKITESKSNEFPSTMECLRKNLWVTFYISAQSGNLSEKTKYADQSVIEHIRLYHRMRYSNRCILAMDFFVLDIWR
ncbi:SCO-spondin [Trichinella spiralis]|uniref:SCO-spondin n=1 Tax=Trichinella spiralis TaxID=6334 RepID=A0ABR3KM86_TRISP